MGEPASASLDLTGLPVPVVDELRRLVATLRSNLGHPPAPEADPAGESSAELANLRALFLWLDETSTVYAALEQLVSTTTVTPADVLTP